MVNLTSNRTSLELKSLSSWLVVAQFIAPLTLLIRTSLELKQTFSSLRSMRERTFNRTSLELKPVRIASRRKDYALLIAPIWN